jgi:hypothetical protein
VRKLLLPVLTIAIITTSGPTDADACGDKLLRIGRNFRSYQANVKKRPAKMLIYTPSNSATLPGAAAAKIQDYFQKVGHKPLAVDSIGKLNEALKSAHYDLVLTDIADAANLQRLVEGSPSQTVVLPVLYRRSKVEEAAAASQYPVLIKNPKDEGDFLQAIYKVMQSRATGRKA